MKIKLLSLLFALSFCSMIIPSCSDEEGDNTSSTFDHLIAHEWKIISAERRTSTGNTPEAVDQCRMDNVFRYEADGTYKLFVGSDLCTVGETGLTGTWTLTANDSKISISIPGIGSYEDNIESISATQLKLKADFSSYSVIELYEPVP